METKIEHNDAVREVRNMAFQFADLYFTFVAELRERFGEEQALEIATRVLFRRAAERALDMVRRAERQLIANAQAQYSSMQEVAKALGVDVSTISRKLSRN